MKLALPNIFSLKLIVATLFMAFYCAAATAEDSSTNKTLVDIENMFVPTGWMGDGEYGRKYISLAGADKINPHSPPTSIKIKYRFGPKRWAGIYWQNKPDNWGNKPGNNYSKKGISQLLFWARGENGDEVIEFKSGDISDSSKPHRDSYGVTTGRIHLSKNWKEYKIGLAGTDLSSVIGGFCWEASADYNPGASVTFYIDDIAFK